MPVYPPLEPLVAQVYRAFQGVPRPVRVSGCTHCVEPDEDHVLVSTPLRQLTYPDLERFVWKAVTTWGTEEDFRYFAPRVLEIAVLEEPEQLDLERVLSKFAVAGYDQWATAERAAIGQLLTGYWAAYLDRYPTAYPVDDVLSGLAYLIDIEPLLHRWTALPTPAAALHLRDLVDSSMVGGSQVPPVLDVTRSVDAWLRRPELRASVQDAFFRAVDPTVAAALSRVDGYLDWLFGQGQG